MRRSHFIGTSAVLVTMVGGAILLPLNGVPQTAAIPATSTGIPFSLPIPSTLSYKIPSEMESLRRQAAAEEAARQEEQRLAAVAAEEERRRVAAAEEARSTPTPKPTPKPTQAPAPAPVAAAGSSSGSDATRLCIMRKESGGNYSIVSSNGMYHGAYQFSRSTGDATAKRMGRSDLVGTPVSQWTPAEQDQAFWTLWAGGAGRSNWPTANGC